MKKLTVLFVIMAFVVCGASSAMAAEPAAHIKDTTCVISPAASGVPIMLTTKDREKSVESASGNVTLTCHFKFDAKKYKVKAQKHEKFLCNTGFGLTKDSSSVTAPGGQVTLKCAIKPPKPAAKPVKPVKP
jgi:hypothetical protein